MTYFTCTYTDRFSSVFTQSLQLLAHNIAPVALWRKSAGFAIGRLQVRVSAPIYSAFHPFWVGKWVPAIAGKVKAGVAHSDCGWTYGCAGKTVKSLENTYHTWAPLRWWFTTKRRYIDVCTFTFEALSLRLYLYLILFNCIGQKRHRHSVQKMHIRGTSEVWLNLMILTSVVNSFVLVGI